MKQNPEEMTMSEVLSMANFDLPAVNDVIEGEVVRVTNQEVTVDIHGATEGTIYLNELTLDKVDSAKDVVKIGDKIKAMIKKVDDEQILLSRRALLEYERFQELKTAFEKGETLVAKVERVVKGGLIVNIGLEAFLPANMIDVKYVSDLNQYVSQEIPVRIVEFNARNRKIKVSRKMVIAEQLKAARDEQFSTLALGEIVEGEVVRIEKYGAFVRFGSLEGLVHISEISHLPVANVEDALTVGQKVSAKVIKIDGTKLQLSIKATLMTPFEQFASTHQVGDVLDGQVVRLMDFGAFVEVAAGVEGLVHLSELSWDHKAKLDEVVSEGQTVRVRILSMDNKNHRLALSIKQVEQDPWVAFGHQVGDVIKGQVTNVTDLGAFIKVAPYIEGLCHYTEASWNPQMKLASMVAPMDEVEVKIISLDAKKHRLGLSLRQVKSNPWESVTFKTLDVVKGTVVATNDRGAFVAVEEDVVGFLPMNQITEKRISRVEDVLTVGQEVEVKVTRFEPKQFKLELSIRRIVEDAEREEFNNYMQKQEAMENETLGDLFGDALKNLL
ncbi:MAG: S1 RNA-binding domain-containing protein [Turicibacter sp.]|uniref:30S ribosomal protein S1 n=1 Tax=Turicibacter faecis TaxID=2963365 RepID=A0ABN6ZHR3_9FIRM|nr:MULTISPECIES: S1 RNA-binding domain-containing protein [unclassified Turicibacter]MCI8701451.1 S1 RNA-binding domain-containing protein [Turicibacter sp.]BEH91335.1 30S ribosomal protein S1 [Turicibacter sp. TC023]MCI9350648.1 S1 RNA-binding domain-containing protein [Turicibacter sp.]MCU7203968.1 S1 RNA-binding domain-containing protein [Turicibacter sp. TA25]NCE77541.1 S1 RNA-binding domain-containing protein [Turicibacter sp. TS3]